MVIGVIYQRFIEIVLAPINTPDMLWIILPLVTAMFLLEFYFGYSKEKLGWNSAVANSLILVFISIDLFRRVYEIGGFDITSLSVYTLSVKIKIAAIVAIGGIWLLINDFFRWIPERIAFFVCSPLVINLIAYLSVIFVYSDLPLDKLSFVAGVILFGILFGFFSLTDWLIPRIAALREEKATFDLGPRKREKIT